MKGNADVARHRLPGAQGRSERPLPRGNPGRFVQVGTSGGDDVNRRDVSVCVHDHADDIAVFATCHGRRRVLRIDMLHDDRGVIAFDCAYASESTSASAAAAAASAASRPPLATSGRASCRWLR